MARPKDAFRAAVDQLVMLHGFEPSAAKDELVGRALRELARVMLPGQLELFKAPSGTPDGAAAGRPVEG